MKSPISFDARAVAPLSLFLAKDDIRFYLAGLYVTPAPLGTGCILAATDGHQIALWHDASGVCQEDVILNIGDPMIKACRKRSMTGRLTRSADDRLSLVDTAGIERFIQAEAATIEANYPDIWRVIPAGEALIPGLHGYIATRLLKIIGKAAARISRQLNIPLAASHYSVGTHGDGAILTRFEGLDHLLVITMPVRTEAYPDPNPLPGWASPRQQQPAAPATANYPAGSMGEEVGA